MFPTLSASVEDIKTIYDQLDQTFSQIAAAFTGGSGSGSFADFTASIMSNMDNIMVSQVGAIVVGFITLFLYTSPFIVGFLT